MPYYPSPIPLNQDDMRRYLDEELRRIDENVISQPTFYVEELNGAPDRPTNGMIVYADGTNWNPGSGEGFYGYEAGAWVKL